MDRTVPLAKHASDIIMKTASGLNVIGVGTGRTVSLILDYMPASFFEEKLFVSSSIDTEFKLKKRGGRVLDILAVDSVDIYFDSADWFDSECNLIKGGGGALLREKLLLTLSNESLIFVTPEKYVDNIMEKPIPIEVSPPAYNYVRREMEKRGLNMELREDTGKGAKWGPRVSDNGNWLADVRGVARLAARDVSEADLLLTSITGVVATGIFPSGLFNKLVVSDPDGSLRNLLKCGGKAIFV